MNLPGFNAEVSLSKLRRTYHGKYLYGGFFPNERGTPALILPSQFEAVEELDEGNELRVVDESDIGEALELRDEF